jgi:hypothetical protein
MYKHGSKSYSQIYRDFQDSKFYDGDKRGDKTIGKKATAIAFLEFLREAFHLPKQRTRTIHKKK